MANELVNAVASRMEELKDAAPGTAADKELMLLTAFVKQLKEIQQDEGGVEAAPKQDNLF